MESDGVLVQRVLAGDTDCFRPLVERYQDAVYGVAFSKTGSFADAEDIAQEAFLAAFESLHELKQPSRFGAWLYGIALNKAKMHLRRQRLRDKLPALAARHEPPADEWIAQQEARAVVTSALGCLSDAHRETATLYYINGYSQEDIAGFTRRPLGTIKRRLHDARQRLRKELIAMVESELKKSRPGHPFTARVLREVRRVRVRRTGTHWDYVMVTDEEGKSLLLGALSEVAEALDRHLAGKGDSGAPDLLAPLLDILNAFRSRVREVVILKGPRTTRLGGVLRLQSGTRTHGVAGEAGDWAALAIRADAPIYVHKQVCQEVLMRKDGKPMSEAQAWKEACQRAAKQRFHSTAFRTLAQVLRSLEKDPESERARSALTALRFTCTPPKILDTTSHSQRIEGLRRLEAWVEKCKGARLEAMSMGLLGAVLLCPPAQNLERAVSLLEDAHRLSPSDTRVAFDLATAYAESSRNREALAVLKKLIEGRPQAAQRVTQCKNFKGLWRNPRFRSLFGKPTPEAIYHHDGAQLMMIWNYPRPSHVKSYAPRKLPKVAQSVKRRLPRLLNSGAFLSALSVRVRSVSASGDAVILELENKRSVIMQLNPLESRRVGHSVNRWPGTHPEGPEAFCCVLSATGIRIDALALLKRRGRRIGSALVARRDGRSFVAHLRGGDAVAIALSARAPLLVADDLPGKPWLPFWED